MDQWACMNYHEACMLLSAHCRHNFAPELKGHSLEHHKQPLVTEMEKK